MSIDTYEVLAEGQPLSVAFFPPYDSAAPLFLHAARTVYVPNPVAPGREMLAPSRRALCNAVVTSRYAAPGEHLDDVNCPECVKHPEWRRR